MKSDQARMGQRLRELRLERKLQQGEMARRLAISPAYLSLIETGKRSVQLPILFKALEIYGVPMEAFMQSLGERHVDDGLARAEAAVGDRVARQTPRHRLVGVIPDGFEFDAEGGIWCASVMSNRLVRVDADGTQQVLLEDCDPAAVDDAMTTDDAAAHATRSRRAWLSTGPIMSSTVAKAPDALASALRDVRLIVVSGFARLTRVQIDLLRALADHGRERPVVIFLHFPVAGPMADWNWFGEGDYREHLARIIDGFHVVALFHGHWHASGRYRWRGIDVYNVGSPKHSMKDFFVVRLTDTRLTVASRQYFPTSRWWWVHQKPLDGSDGQAVERIYSAPGERGPLIPYPVDAKHPWSRRRAPGTR